MASAAALVIFTCTKETQAQGPERFSRANTYSFFVEYSIDSSRIILAQTADRKIGAAGFAYSRHLWNNKHIEWEYTLDVLPVMFVRDPVASGTGLLVTRDGNGNQTITATPFAGSQAQDCASQHTVTTGTLADGRTFTYTLDQTCGSRWTYAGGVSPMGMRFSFAKRRRLQPFVVANAGFVMATREIPANFSSRFNFTFQGGGGLEWFLDRQHSLAIDCRLHHLSNAYTAFNNPGIDSVIFRTTYSFGR